MTKEEKYFVDVLLRITPIVLSIISLVISYKTYSSQFQEKFIINDIPAKFLYIDYSEQCLVYENEVIVTNSSRNSISLISCDVKFSDQPVENNMSNQFPVLFSPGEAKKFTYKFSIPIDSKDTSLLSVSENAISEALSNNKRYKYSRLVLRSTQKTYYCSISLKQ